MAAAAGVSLANGDPATAAVIRPGFSWNPFQFGVACSPVDNVIWTKLAVEPLAPDGRGGMPRGDVPVDWVVSRNPDLSDIVASGTAYAIDSDGHTVHHSVSGLPADAELYYRFQYAGWQSTVGRLRTAPRAGEAAPDLKLAVTSCAHYAQGYFHVYRHIATHQVDAVLVVGDIVYTDSADVDVRTHVPAAQCRSLTQYRLRHSQYRLDPDEQAVRASAPLIAILDDHEVDNNWAASIPDKEADGGSIGWWSRRQNALRAFWEHLPFAPWKRPTKSVLDITAHLAWGDLATLHMLDTRQFRSDQNGDLRDKSNRYLLGPVQLQQLGQAYQGARWDILAQQVVMARWDVTPSGFWDSVANTDSWDGYRAEKIRVYEQWKQMDVRNPIVLTGDVHSAWANVLEHIGSAVGLELVTSSISSGGNGDKQMFGLDKLWLMNSHIKYHNAQRGWILMEVGYDDIRVSWRGTQIVTSPSPQPDLLFARCTIKDGVREFRDKWYDLRYSQEWE
ncbi:alkaline phosphatase D family protein [Streptomyces sp. NPDC057273]|uniref:alkaline phosphatase D family protein n=1 Tax=Streptomyces sp. NPDC057273 TaxID=3346080 RepID=UPI00362D3D77